VTIAEYLKTQGYDTAAMGKWHLGGAFYRMNGTRITGSSGESNPSNVNWERAVDFHALDNGFDHFRGNAVAINFVPYMYMIDERMQYWDTSLNSGQGGYRPALNSDTYQFWTTSQVNQPIVGATGSRNGLGDPSYNQVNVGLQLVSDVENYLADRATVNDTDPFFLYIAMHSPHRPWAVSPNYITADTTSNNYVYRDWMREVDGRVGSFLNAIENNGFKDNTVVIFSSDNGPETSEMTDAIARGDDPNGPLRGNKRDAWDGGTRVPFVIRWPGQAAPGMIVNDPVWQGDIFTTIAAYLGSDLPNSTAPDGESFLNLIRGQQKPSPQRPAIVMSSIGGHLGLKTINGWKFIDSTGGGGNALSWDSSNISISNPIGVNQGRPKQLFNQTIDLGEDLNLIAGFTTDAAIRVASQDIAGEDLLGLLDDLRDDASTELFPRIPDNDGDLIPNSFEIANGLDPNWPLDASEDLDGDGSSNLEEFLAGTDINDNADVLLITQITRNGDDVSITWPSRADRSYTVEISTDLGQWGNHSTVEGTGNDVTLTLDLGTLVINGEAVSDPGKLFLRVIVSNTAE